MIVGLEMLNDASKGTNVFTFSQARSLKSDPFPDIEFGGFPGGASGGPGVREEGLGAAPSHQRGRLRPPWGCSLMGTAVKEMKYTPYYTVLRSWKAGL